LRVELPAEFTRPAGACVETIDDVRVYVFHEKRLLGSKRIYPFCEAESTHSVSLDDSIDDQRLCTTWDRACASPSHRAQISRFRDGSNARSAKTPAVTNAALCGSICWKRF
jgi:hypothetical protein